MRLILGTFAALAVAAGTPAMAQSVGMQVVDSSGAPVGTVTAIQGDNIHVKTDKHDVLLPKSSFTPNNGKLLFGMTQAQLDSKFEEASAAAAKAIAPGATVTGAAGTPVGKIDSVDGSDIVIALSSGKKVKLPTTGVRGNPDGTVTIGFTAAQLDALVSGGAAANKSSK